MNPDKIAFSIPEACSAAGLSRSTLYAAMGTGALKARKAGRRTIIRPADLNRWLDGLPTMR